MPALKVRGGFRIRIAGIDIGVHSKNKDLELKIPSVYSPFILRDEVEEKNIESEIKIEVCCGPAPSYQPLERIFETGSTWTLYGYKNKKIIETPSVEFRSLRRQMAVFESDYKKGTVYVPGTPLRPQSIPVFKNPFGEVLMVNLLAQGRGVMLHSCAVGRKGEAFLFAGASGSGKSTIAHLWETAKEAVILNDDRVILRQESGSFRVYGTPWHGTAFKSSPQNFPLKKIFFLKKAKTNVAKRLRPAEALSRFIACSFPTYWDAGGMLFTIDFCAHLSQHFTCYELGFLPEKSVLDYILNKM